MQKQKKIDQVPKYVKPVFEKEERLTFPKEIVEEFNG